jgi:chemotaxis protein CheD
MEQDIKTHYLYPSALFASKEAHIVDTILGSCVAVCLFDNKLEIGGINHFMLPLWNGTGLASPKYGNVATEKLIKNMLANGSQVENLIAKVFGGANQMDSTMDIGDRNIAIAKEILENHGIRVMAENTGGSIGRKLRYETHTGAVKMKFLKKG